MVLAEFEHVAEHVVQAPGVWRLRPDRLRAARKKRRPVVAVVGGIICGGRVAAEPGSGIQARVRGLAANPTGVDCAVRIVRVGTLPGAGRQFPFGLGRQAVSGTVRDAGHRIEHEVAGALDLALHAAFREFPGFPGRFITGGQAVRRRFHVQESDCVVPADVLDRHVVTGVREVRRGHPGDREKFGVGDFVIRHAEWFRDRDLVQRFVPAAGDAFRFGVKGTHPESPGGYQHESGRTGVFDARGPVARQAAGAHAVVRPAETAAPVAAAFLPVRAHRRAQRRGSAVAAAGGEGCRACQQDRNHSVFQYPHYRNLRVPQRGPEVYNLWY